MATILVIDDDKDIQRLLEFALKRVGYTVESAYDGQQGLAYAEAYHPDLIICDVMMPKMTGYEFCRQARAKAELKKTPIIVFSARFQPIDRQTALDAGATDYLSKSTAPDVLIKRIVELLPQSAAAKPSQGMVGVFSLRGGVGVSSLAVNLAIALALKEKSATTLIDLATLSGHAALMLGVRPTSNVAKLLAAGEDGLGPQTIKNYLIQHSSGVQLLASPLSFSEQLTPNNSGVLRLLSAIKAGFPLSVLDFPHLLEPHFSPALQLLDKILLVISPDMPAVQSTAIALQSLLSLGMADTKISLVVNQVMQYNMLPLEVIQKTIKRPIAAAIPFDPNMIKAVNASQPLILSQPQSPAAQAIGQLAGKIFAIAPAIQTPGIID